MTLGCRCEAAAVSWRSGRRPHGQRGCNERGRQLRRRPYLSSEDREDGCPEQNERPREWSRKPQRTMLHGFPQAALVHRISYRVTRVPADIKTSTPGHPVDNFEKPPFSPSYARRTAIVRFCTTADATGSLSHPIGTGPVQTPAWRLAEE